MPIELIGNAHVIINDTPPALAPAGSLLIQPATGNLKVARVANTFTDAVAGGIASGIKQTAEVSGSDSTVFFNVTGMAFVLTSGKRYHIKFIFAYQVSNTSCGMKVAFTSPAMTFWQAETSWRTNATTVAGAFLGAPSLDPTTVVSSSSTTATGTNYMAMVEIICQPSADGTLQLTVAPELNGATLTVPNMGIGILFDLG